MPSTGPELLLIDAGNSSVKVALYSGKILRVGEIPTKTLRGGISPLLELIRPLRFDKVVVSCVVKPVGESLRKVFRDATFVSPELKLPLRFEYDVERLGADRISAACGAVSRHGDSLFVVSLGTAVFVDLVLERVFRGGAIFPGFDLMFSSLHRWTSSLPLVSLKGAPPDFPGKNTQECIASGVFLAVVGGIREALKRCKGLKVILTGGYCELLKGYLEGVVDRDLVFEGMVEIYRLNA